MAEIRPFRGLLYNPQKAGDISKVMAPPYDVISPEFQDELYSRHPNNIIRLILGKDQPGDRPGSDKYSRAAGELKRWIEVKVLAQDQRPAIYCYIQRYSLKDGRRFTRKGFIALSRLEEFGKGKIHAHEQTLSGPKADRLRLMLSCEANLSCIFSLYSEPGLKINKSLKDAVGGRPPLIDAIDDNGVENLLWRIDDSGVIEKVSAAMKSKTLFIADGHHRYETALNFRNIMREKNPSHTGVEPYNYVMMYFSNMDDEGMTIWPTHRIIHSLKGFDTERLIKECSGYFDIDEFKYSGASESKARGEFLKKLEDAGFRGNAIGLHIYGRPSYYILTLKGKDIMDKVFGIEIPAVFKGLDVTVLHSLVFSKILGITKEREESQTNIIYVKGCDEALDEAKNSGNQAVFILNPTRIEQVKSVAEAGYVMPQKSTYFYPKLLSGLVINIFAERPAHSGAGQALRPLPGFDAKI